MSNPRIPMLFVRVYPCTPETGLRPNSTRRARCGCPARISYVVLHPKHNDWKQYNSQWMNDPCLITDHRSGHGVYVHDVDIVADEDKYVFDSDDSEEALHMALMKMQQLWATIQVPNVEEVSDGEG